METLYELLDLEVVQALIVAALSWLSVQGWKKLKQIPDDVRVPEKKIRAGVAALLLAVLGEWARIRVAPEADSFNIAKVALVAGPAMLNAFGWHNLVGRYLPSPAP